MVNTVRHTYYSLNEFADAAKNAPQAGHNVYSDQWCGGSFKDAQKMCELGWAEGLTEAMAIVEAALQHIEREVPAITFNAYHDVSGSQVDISRYLAGTPECMVEYEPTTISRVGRIITLVASCVYSAAISADSVMKRGAAITALALALERTGHEVELWADFSCVDDRNDPKYRCETRVLVKGAHDIVDPERIAYAYAHPSFLRRLLFSAWVTMPYKHRQKLNIPDQHGKSASYGSCKAPAHDLPEGTIYLPELHSSVDVEEPDKFILDTLRDIGLIEA